MKERGIIFSAPSIPPILAGTKTMTRRVCKGQRELSRSQDFQLDRCPYGKPGDRLFVKEPWRVAECYDGLTGKQLEGKLTARNVQYETGDQFLRHVEGRYRHARFMPRWASRITLEVVSVRVERLQAISEADAVAEGMKFTDFGRKCLHRGKWQDVGDCPAPESTHPQRDGWHWKPDPPDHTHCLSAARWAYVNLWESINGFGSWDANPLVWVVEFKRAES